MRHLKGRTVLALTAAAVAADLRESLAASMMDVALGRTKLGRVRAADGGGRG